MSEILKVSVNHWLPIVLEGMRWKPGWWLGGAMSVVDSAACSDSAGALVRAPRSGCTGLASTANMVPRFLDCIPTDHGGDEEGTAARDAQRTCAGCLHFDKVVEAGVVIDAECTQGSSNHLWAAHEWVQSNLTNQSGPQSSSTCRARECALSSTLPHRGRSPR
jgi:hypothetical protein